MYIRTIVSQIGVASSNLLKRNTTFKRFNSTATTVPLVQKMGDEKYIGLKLDTIIEKLEGFAATKLAEAWDNVGLLIDPMEDKPISKILLTNDLTEDVLQEAVDLKVGMIVSYHPPIFKPLKALTTRSWKERIVIQCLKNSIAIFSPHTSWDVVQGGVNEWLSKSVSPKSSEPILETGTGRICQLSEPISVKTAVEKIKSHIGIPHLRLALAVGKNMESSISTVALCAGSGATVLAGMKADLYLTGEMLHHDVWDANHNGAHVILCNHSDSERGFLRYFAPILQDKLLEGSVQVVVSEKDADPLKTV